LVAEVIGGELARAVGLDTPELVLVDVDPVLGVAEPDREIQDLLEASGGLNLGVDYLPGALSYAGADPVDADWAADVVWLDTLLMNVDRTPRNPNLLCWHGRVWLIDHGAAIYPQHAGTLVADTAFPQIADHVLLPSASSLAAAHDRLAPKVDPRVVDAVPEEWLVGPPRDAYAQWLSERSALVR
jgi:hypothetical protein